ncbi:hypothetical protein BSLG_003929 [Batrachochytrium salamandrivorans]|nr:hypothetical protein BSLG_003929 [Batrachochytrium salamandrivorans]
MVTSRFRNLALVHNIIRTWNIPCNLDAFKLILKTYLIQGDFDLTCETYAEIKKRGLDRMDRGVLSLMCRAHIQHGKEKSGIEFFQKLLNVDYSHRPYAALMKAYAKAGKEIGMITTLQKMNMANIKMNADVLAIVCHFYISRGKYDMVDGFISEFKLNGGEITLPLYLIQAKVFNLTCNYQATIDLFKEMRLARIKSNSSVYSQEIVAYAGLNNMPMVWKVYSQVEDLITLHKSAAIGMAKMFGSLDGTGTLGNIKAAICLAMLPHNRTLHNLISEYVANGDAESVKLLIHHLHPSRNYSPTASLDHVIWAYYFAGDAIKALAYAKELDSQHTLIDYDVWYATLVCVVKFNPADIDGVVSHIRLKYPNVDIEAELCRAKIMAALPHPSKIVCSAIGSGSHRRSAISRHLVSACTAAGIFECTHRATRTVLGSYRQLWASYHSNGISPDTSHVASTVLDGRVSTANPTEAELPYLTKQLESEIPDCSEMTNPSDLANLPTEYFTMLISMVLFNKNRVVATMSSAQRLDNAHMILELMKKHGVVQNLSTIIVAVNIYGRLRDLQAVEASYNYAKQHGFRINDHSLLAGMCHAHILNGNDLRGRWF